MKGVTITKKIKNNFDKRIDFLNKRIDDLHKDFKGVKSRNNKNEIFDWKTSMICHRNELAFIKEILENVKIIEDIDNTSPNILFAQWIGENKYTKQLCNDRWYNQDIEYVGNTEELFKIFENDV